MQRLRDPQPGCRQEADQRSIRLGQQRVGRGKPRGGEDETSDLDARINARDTTSLPISEVVRRWQFVPGVFDAKILSKAADCLVTRVSLRDRSRLAGPVDGCGCADVGLLLIGCEVSETAQEIDRKSTRL